MAYMTIPALPKKHRHAVERDQGLYHGCGFVIEEKHIQMPGELENNKRSTRSNSERATKSEYMMRRTKG
jgi:hypothetical protein